MTKLRVKFGRRLRQLREAKRMSQEEMANRSGIHRTYPSKLENGLRGVSLDVIENLADTLDVEPAELLTFEDLD